VPFGRLRPQAYRQCLNQPRRIYGSLRRVPAAARRQVTVSVSGLAACFARICAIFAQIRAKLGFSALVHVLAAGKAKRGKRDPLRRRLLR